MHQAQSSIPANISRRQWLQWLATTSLGGMSLASHAALATAAWPVSEQLFGLGIASGEPASDSVVLWTRLLPSPRMPLLGPQSVQWEIAHDEQFQHGVQKGEALATTDWGHSVHVLARGLAQWLGTPSTMPRWQATPKPRGSPSSAPLPRRVTTSTRVQPMRRCCTDIPDWRCPRPANARKSAPQMHTCGI